MSPRRQRHLKATLCLCCLVTTGCGDAGAGSPSRTGPDAQEARSRALEHKQLARVPPERPAVSGEVPAEVMDRIRDQLAKRTGAPAASFEVVRAEQQEWPSGAMGCPQPGMNYTQSPIRGYRVVLRGAGRDYDYRVSESGYFVVCDAMSLPQPPTR